MVCSPRQRSASSAVICVSKECCEPELPALPGRRASKAATACCSSASRSSGALRHCSRVFSSDCPMPCPLPDHSCARHLQFQEPGITTNSDIEAIQHAHSECMNLDPPRACGANTTHTGRLACRLNNPHVCAASPLDHAIGAQLTMTRNHTGEDG